MADLVEAEASKATSGPRIALVPLNELARVKSRLRGVLAPADRAALVLQLAERVFAALSGSGIVTRIGLVSPEARTLVRMRESSAAGANTPRIVAVPTDGVSLNADLEQARTWALAQGASEILVVLPDLPLLTAETVRRMVDLGRSECTTNGGAVVLARDRKGRGTNALLLRPGDAISFAFGQGSLARHIALASAAGIEPVVFESEEASFDVDTPADLRELTARGLWIPSDTSRQAVAG